MARFRGTLKGVEQAKPGTEWTEPGQGATVGELLTVIHAEVHKNAGQQQNDENDAAHDSLHAILRNSSKSYRDAKLEPTNLRLTGAPLTAEDIQRISEAK